MLHSKDSVSFHEFIEDINKNYSKEENFTTKNFYGRQLMQMEY